MFPVTQGTTFLGYRIFRTHRLLKRENVRRFERRLKGLQRDHGRGAISVKRVGQSVRSWIANACYADTYGLRRRLLGGVTFQRGQVERARGSGRLVALSS